MVHSRWFRLVVIVVMIVAGGFFLWQYNQVDKSQLVNSDGRVFEKARVVEIVRDNLQEDGSRVGDQIVTLRMEDGPDAGQTVQANCPNGLLFGTVCQLGMAVIVISANVGAMGVHTVYNVDRSLPIYLYIAAFLILLSVIGGKKGVKSAVALIFTCICFLFLFFPMVLRGMGPVTAAVITSVIVLAATMYLINGWTKKSLAAFGATLGGILTACLAAILFGHAVNLSGYNVSNIENLMFVAQNTLIDVGQILFVGILFASLGAVMDIAMDVTAACAELERHKPDIRRKALFTAGMNVGRDVMGTMSTTLILAFFGGSLGVWLLDYAYDLPYLQLINSNAVGIEIMKAFSASFGVLFTVPIAAALSAVTHKVEKK
ncbi:MAG: YibE/F family protein [Megasphaera sp.]|uniref:YibE/F family protein n=1 Tax=Megasphaera sp. TaxID=2023260 RepID=UPI0025C134E2|nr:YibE/F family protein [Megasphaera sp.]MCI7599699.1 YibE/F family protein [Megasphaera sp.]